MTMQQLIDRIIAWAEGDPGVRAAVVIGSRARADYSADEWSDLDLLLVVADANRFIEQTDWLEAIGPYWLTFLEGAAVGESTERRVLFDGGLDVDFVPVPLDSVRNLVQHGVPLEAWNVFRRGMRFIVDKEGLETALAQAARPKPELPQPPGESEFINTVNDFWYHAVWTTKKLRRGELWTAKLCLDSYMKSGCLLKMLEWHARATQGWDYDTWHHGRFLEKWADPRAVEGLRAAFAHYDADDVRRALLATMDLFRWLADETAEELGYDCPTQGAQRVAEWVRQHLAEA